MLGGIIGAAMQRDGAKDLQLTQGEFHWQSTY
jgi:hypothetical protein